MPVDTATNQLLGENYNSHGEQTSLMSSTLGALTLGFTDFGEVGEISRNGQTTQYAYDISGDRIGVRDHSGDWKISIRGLGGETLSEYAFDGIDWSHEKDYVYRGSKPVAAITDSGINHFHIDHLGSIRLITDEAGERVAYHEYEPFGMEMTSAYQDEEAKKFTGHERDFHADPGTSFDLDYMHARYYSPYERRFLSVDPVGGDPGMPQSWNGYSYVMGNPLKWVDPTGESVSVSFDEETNTYYISWDVEFSGGLTSGASSAAAQKIAESVEEAWTGTVEGPNGEMIRVKTQVNWTFSRKGGRYKDAGYDQFEISVGTHSSNTLEGNGPALTVSRPQTKNMIDTGSNTGGVTKGRINLSSQSGLLPGSAAHEFGHVLGIPLHTKYRGDVMSIWGDQLKSSEVKLLNYQVDWLAVLSERQFRSFP